MTYQIISPHPDDACLSLGQFLAAEPGCEVWTMMAGIPTDDVPLSDYDAARGFRTSRAAMQIRRGEDCLALGLLDATWTHGPFFDAQYGLANDRDEMRAWLAPAFSDEWHTFVPLGIGHPDHVEVARICREVAYDERLAYEELPYRVANPEQVVDALADWESDGWKRDLLPYPLPQGDRAEKRAGLECYGSQWPNGPDEPMFYCPERVWRFTR